MKKVAIVGVEGSGKTVMLAGLGDLYTYPDEEGYFLAPKNFGTAAYVNEKIARMRKGEWPSATAGDEMQGLDWTLKRREPGVRKPAEKVCEVSFLDFAGEVYRAAYGISSGGDASLKEQAEELKQYVCGADELIVLINLRDVITNGLRDTRVQEAMWITKSILDTALGDAAGTDAPRAAIVLSQADSYASTIESCGGARGVLRRHLPHVANDYDWLDVFAVNAVDKTELDNDGNVVPAADFTTKGLVPILKWVRGEAALDGIGRGATAQPGNATAGGTRMSRSDDNTDGVSDGAKAVKRVQLWEGGPYWADRNIGAEELSDSGYYFWWGDTVGYKRKIGIFNDQWIASDWIASDGSYPGFTFGGGRTPTYGKSLYDLRREGWITTDNVLAPEHDAAHVQWGGGWRMPTEQELDDLCNKCDWIWTTTNGVNGYVVRGKGDFASDSIFLPCAGYGYGTSIGSFGSHGYYWSSVPNSDDSYGRAYVLNFDSSYHRTSSYGRRYYGQSVRPVHGVTK